MIRITRRNLLQIAGAAGAATALPLQSADAGTTRSRRKLLFNWDGSMIHCFGRAALGTDAEHLSVDQFRSLVFSVLDEQAVDTVLFSFGSGNVAEYHSNVLEWPGEADRFAFPESKTWHGGIEVDAADQYRNPKALADAGHNPPELLVRECHQRGMAAFVSLRMNDCHDGQHPPGSLPNPELATFKRQNPDWLIQDLDWWSALDFSHPRVRALKLKTIEEFFDRWDFDGIELDWLRHTLNFPRGTEQENSHHLTNFLRSVRESLNDRAKKRGRPIEIAVRVPEQLAWCRLGGFDVPRWVGEDLVDMLIVGQSLTELPTLSEFHELRTEAQIPVYPALTPYGNGYRLSPDEVIRGSAAQLWADGADGLYLSNWCYYGDWRRHLLKEIAGPETLAERPKRFTLSQRVAVPRGQTGADYIRYNVQGQDAPLPVQIKPNSPWKFTIGHGAGGGLKIGRHQKAELWIALDFPGEQDVLKMSFNGQEVEVPMDSGRIVLSDLGQQIDIPDGHGILGFSHRDSVDERFRGIRVSVPAVLLTSGRNEVELVLVERTRGLKHDLRISRVELNLA